MLSWERDSLTASAAHIEFFKFRHFSSQACRVPGARIAHAPDTAPTRALCERRAFASAYQGQNSPCIHQILRLVLDQQPLAIDLERCPCLNLTTGPADRHVHSGALVPRSGSYTAFVAA